MKLRVMVVKTFDEEDEARDFWKDIKNMWPKSEGLPSDSANLHECHHDEEPHTSCVIIEELP